MIDKLFKLLKNKIKKSEYVYIIGHNNIDLDAFGSAIGISLIATKYNRKSFIIMDDKILEKGVNKALSLIKDRFNFVKTSFLKDKDLSASILVIVDTNKGYLVSCNKFFDKFKEIIVIDHHNVDKETLNNSINNIDINSSSTCEITADLIKKFFINISPTIATIIFSGIVLDTNNFVLRANKKTFYTAYFLLSKGASPIDVQYLLKQDIKKFINRQKMLTNLIIINNKIAIAKGVKKDIYSREELAKVAETLLLFDGIETSFVIGNLNNEEIGISGRTLGKCNIGNLMKKLDGGGNLNEGATKIKSQNIKDVEKKLVDILK